MPSRDSLEAHLVYEPRELKFGTSGRRGEVVHLTQLEIYINVLGELEYLQSLPRSSGGIVRGDPFYFAYDLRPSSTALVAEQQGRGEIAQAVARAIRDSGMEPVNLGAIPTPALTFYALGRSKGSIMVTGSHIPFDRNGYKLNTATGELLKEHEGPINAAVARSRERIYRQSLAESAFDERGFLKARDAGLPAATADAHTAYVRRYLDFFGGGSLEGMRVLVYQHSSVGRDLLIDVLDRLGAETIAAGRSDTFVPIDTENMNAPQLAAIAKLAADAQKQHGEIHAIVSADGDADRPLILEAAPAGTVRFFGGDLVGMVVAESLEPDAVVVPISCNDAIDCGALASITEPKTQIGSPYVIAGMEKARRKGKTRVCGWEANGGFLLGSDFERNGRVLGRLETRDALLPILSVLFEAKSRRVSLSGIFDKLPKRYSRTALIRDCPRATGLEIVRRFSPADQRIKHVRFEPSLEVRDGDGGSIVCSPDLQDDLMVRRRQIAAFFPADAGFAGIQAINYVDGVRVLFGNGEVAHVRPSGNADELRVYAVADAQPRADAIAQAAVAEPHGILRQMQAAVESGAL